MTDKQTDNRAAASMPPPIVSRKTSKKMGKIIIGTAAMLVCGASLIDGSAFWLLGVVVGAALILKGINRLRKQD